MADTVVSDARIYPQDEGFPNISDGSESWNSAGWQALLSMAKDSSGSYARSDSELVFENHDATDNVVDLTAGVAYLDMAGETLDVQSDYGGSGAPAYDLALPSLPLIAVTLPSTVADIPLQDATLSPVWIAYATDDSVSGVSVGDVYIRSDDTGGVTAPPHPNVKLGEANPDDSAADVVENRYGSSEFESMTADRIVSVSSTQEPPIDQAGQWWIRADEPGTSIWSHSLHSGSVLSVFERDGVVYSGSYDNTVIAADSSDGSEIWSHSLHSDSLRTVFERDGVVYSGANDNTVIAAVSMPASYVAAPDLSGGSLDWQLNSKLHSELDRR